MGCGDSKEAGPEPPSVKVLLLGAGCCGKTTFIKQMKLNFEGGFPEDELQETSKQIQSNMVQRMAQVLVDESVASTVSGEAQEHVDVVAQAAQAEHEFQENNRFVEKVNVALKYLVQNEAVAAYVDAHFYDAPWDYDFFKKMDKIMSVDYKSTPMEVLACRKATTGYHEYFFTIDKNVLLFVDVGGQRKERATWVKAMENVTAVIYVGALTDYAIDLEEDTSRNRMDESLDLFERVYHSQKLKTVPTILFLNKTDLFKEMIQKQPLDDRYDTYVGGSDSESSLQFITNLFVARTKTKPTEKQLMSFPVCSTDPDNFMKVFIAIKNILMTSNLIAAGLL